QIFHLSLHDALPILEILHEKTGQVEPADSDLLRQFLDKRVMYAMVCRPMQDLLFDLRHAVLNSRIHKNIPFAGDPALAPASLLIRMARTKVSINRQKDHKL